MFGTCMADLERLKECLCCCMKGVKISWNFSRKGVKVLLLLVKVYGILVGMGLKCFCCCSKGVKVSWNFSRKGVKVLLLL